MDARGRLTLPDLMNILMGLAFLGALSKVFWPVLNDNAGSLSTGEAYLVQLVVPLLVIVLMAVIYVTAIAGVGR